MAKFIEIDFGAEKIIISNKIGSVYFNGMDLVIIFENELPTFSSKELRYGVDQHVLDRAYKKILRFLVDQA